MSEEIVATQSLRLWGGAVEIHCYGRDTGDWAMRGGGPEVADARNPGIVDRVAELAKRHGCVIYSPHPQNFNSLVIEPEELSTEWVPGLLYRGAEADAVSLNEPGQAFAVASADCPTVVLYSSRTGTVVPAHAGMASLHVRDSFRNGVVARAAARCGGPGSLGRSLHAFAACGIGAQSYRQPHNHPTYGNANRELTSLLMGTYGWRSPYPHEDGHVSLRLIIAAQLAACGLHLDNIGHDGCDTYDDRDARGDYLWHSHRRNGNGSRNLVLVIRRK